LNTIIIYYTFGGSTKKEAEKMADELGAQVCRVREKRNRSLIGSFIPGGLQARRRKSTKIQPVETDLGAFDKIIIGCPVWAAYPAPAFNSIVDLLPAGKEVEILLCSGGDGPRESDAGTREMIEAKGCKCLNIRTVATGVPPGKLKE
jgi:flavodoxin